MHYCPPPKQVLNDNIMIVTGPADGARSCDDFEMEIHKEMMKKLMYLLQDVSEICDFSRESLIWPLEPMYSLILTHNWLLHRNFLLADLWTDPFYIWRSSKIFQNSKESSSSYLVFFLKPKILCLCLRSIFNLCCNTDCVWYFRKAQLVPPFPYPKVPAWK